MNEHQGEHWMTLLINIWRHTPLGIMLSALKRPRGEQRARQVTGARSNPSRGIATP
jgi:hypothetical protein